MAWTIDPAHSQIIFSARHMMISNVTGRFENFEGTVDFDETNPTASQVDVTIQAGTINTREPQRDAHLRSPDFLNVEQYPTLTFKSKRIEVTGAKSGRLIGDLTIRDITHEVALDVDYAGQAKSPWGATQAGFSASTRINRKDWNLVWNVALETGGWLVGETIKIDIDLELIKQAEAAPEAAVGKTA